MFSKNSVKAVRNNAFKAAVVVLGGAALVMTLSACSPVSSLKSAYEGQPFPQMPAPEVATYVLDMSGSTYPTAQLEALGSGINDFIAGQSLGNPFAQSPVAPRGLSIQFVTKNSAQAPRILLVSTKTSQSLYDFIKENTPNLEGALQLWNGLINARTQIWQDEALEANQAACVEAVVAKLGRQQLLPDALKIPAGIICQDAKQTATSFKRLQDFVAEPGIEMGSDVKGAVEASLRNLATAKAENPSARLTLVIASDMVDEVSLSLPRRLSGSDYKGVCNMAIQDAGNAANDYSSVNVVIVGARNSKINTNTLDQVQAYWTCYLNQIGITNITEQSDLSGF
ncbi:hypothetical protein MCEMZLE2_00465 [Candidatus Nanopelagicaceae bacterium]